MDATNMSSSELEMSNSQIQKGSSGGKSLNSSIAITTQAYLTLDSFLDTTSHNGSKRCQNLEQQFYSLEKELHSEDVKLVAGILRLFLYIVITGNLIFSETKDFVSVLQVITIGCIYVMQVLSSKRLFPSDWPEETITDDEYEAIKEGKDKRSTAHLGPEMMFYNRLENEILARIMKLLDNSFRKIGVNLAKHKWFGPGQAAQEWLKNRAPSREEIQENVPDWFRKCARESYYGGWFEIFAHGLIPGNAYEYDINSAYPFVIASLPCLLHGIYTRGRGLPTIDLEQKEICLVRAYVSGKGDAARYTGTLPYRNKNGGICRPTMVEGIYWWHELQAAKRSGAIDNVRYFEWFKYTPCDCPAPLREIEDLYSLRLSVGKNTPFGLACKLVYNSMYGKFAQSIGEPMFANAIYASLITAGCRTMIYDAIATHPIGWESVLMVATDGIYFMDEHPELPLSKTELGKWDCTKRENMTLFKPGVYWDDKTRENIDKGDAPVFKARGISAKDFAESITEVDYQFAIWENEFIHPDEWPTVKYTPQFHMTTALQALIQHDWSLAGLVQNDKEMVQNSYAGEKRFGVAYFDSTREIYRTIPKAIDFPYDSKPYKKKFGETSEIASQIWFTQEWMEAHGITPDEYVGESFTRAVTGKD